MTQPPRLPQFPATPATAIRRDTGQPLPESAALDDAKRFVNRHFERLLVVLLVASLLFIQQVIEHKLAFLSFYYLPIILAGFLEGRRTAVWAALLVVLLVGYLQTLHGLVGAPGLHAASLFYLVPWGGFLILTGYTVGTLAEQRQARTDEVRGTYLAMLELLSLHVDSSDRMRRGHSYRVGERAVALARELGLDDVRQEDLRIAGLLHEIGPRDPRLVRAMSELPSGSDAKVSSMRSALRLVDEYSHYHEVVSSGSPVDDTRITLGSKILAVSDAYDTLQTPTATRNSFAPWTALEEIERGMGSTFASEVVKALRTLAARERQDLERAAPGTAMRLA